jgi:hypothetical protein
MQHYIYIVITWSAHSVLILFIIALRFAVREYQFLDVPRSSEVRFINILIPPSVRPLTHNIIHEIRAYDILNVGEKQPLPNHQTMRCNWGVEAMFHIFLASTLLSRCGLTLKTGENDSSMSFV